MKEIREIFETIRTYCGMMFLENRAAKQLGSQPIKIERLVAYPSKSSLTREDLCYGKVAHDNNFDSPETVYSLLTTHHSLKRAAFTLAEVLITLGIIGVVAALTLPTLIQNHQKQVYVTQLKKSYSAMNNAINKMAADEGVVDWSQTLCASLTYDDRTGGNVSRVNECFDGLAKQMNAIKTKQWMQICNEDWCSINHVSSSGEDYIFATSDGATYVFPCAIFPFYYVDVNGTAKGPNQDGRDIFGFDAEGSNSAENFTYIGANKLTPNGAHSWSPNAWKNCSATNLSTDCTAKVLIEGKMNY